MVFEEAGAALSTTQATPWFLSLTGRRCLHSFSPRRRWGEVRARGYYSKQAYNSSSSSRNYTTGKPSFMDFLLCILLGKKITSPPVEIKWNVGAYARFRNSLLCLSLEKPLWLAISCPGLDSQGSEAISLSFPPESGPYIGVSFPSSLALRVAVALMISHMINTFIIVINHQSTSICWY